jgi:hypothetical protein
MVLATSEASAPSPTVGVPVAWSGGQELAQAPVHSLWVPVSFANRYRVRPASAEDLIETARRDVDRSLLCAVGLRADPLAWLALLQPVRANAKSATTAAPFTVPSKPGRYYFQCDVHPRS